MTQVEQERSRIETAVSGQTLCTRFADTVAARHDDPASSDQVGLAGCHGWRTLAWGQTREQAMVTLGLGPGDTVVIMASDRIEHVLADLAAALCLPQTPVGNRSKTTHQR